MSKFNIHYTLEEHSLSHAPILYYMPIIFITTLTTSCMTQTCSSTHSVKPFICLYNVVVVFGECEDCRSNQSDDLSDSEECF